MKLYTCKHCGQEVYFENTRCERCGTALGFVVNTLEVVALEKAENGLYTIWGNNDSTKYRYCKNQEYAVCNWLVAENDSSPFCKACSFNRIIPDLNKPEYRKRWNAIENAKHRLIYSLLRLHLPLFSKAEDETRGLMFDFKADVDNSEQKVLTGHDNGLITLNIAEADDAEREMTRKAMDEVYRTVLGHFRHEIGHYYWDRLIADTTHLGSFRSLFGDERLDYGEALQSYYANGAASNWRESFISAYATMHPWEDWAETWAHYLHIVDTVETAHSFGLTVHPVNAPEYSPLKAAVTIDPYETDDFQKVLDLWFPLTFALNSLNRSMGLHDVYPFVITPNVIKKLSFIHSLCREHGLAYNSKYPV